MYTDELTTVVQLYGSNLQTVGIPSEGDCSAVPYRTTPSLRTAPQSAVTNSYFIVRISNHATHKISAVKTTF